MKGRERREEAPGSGTGAQEGPLKELTGGQTAEVDQTRKSVRGATGRAGGAGQAKTPLSRSSTSLAWSWRAPSKMAPGKRPGQQHSAPPSVLTTSSGSFIQVCEVSEQGPPTGTLNNVSPDGSHYRANMLRGDRMLSGNPFLRTPTCAHSSLLTGSRPRLLSIVLKQVTHQLSVKRPRATASKKVSGLQASCEKSLFV